MGALTLTACEGPKPQQARASENRSTAPPSTEALPDSAAQEEFIHQAHTEALQALERLVDAYLSQVQPVFHAAALGEPLAAPYTPGANEAMLREQLERIQKKMGEIRPEALELLDERRLGAYQDLVNRDLWRIEGDNPAASDALEYLARVRELIAELRFRLLQDAPCEGCDEAIAGLARDLEELSPLLDESGRAKLREASRALRDYGARVSALPLGLPAGQGTPRPWTESTPSKRGETLIERSATWGTAHLEQVFAKEENYAHEGGGLRSKAEAQLTRLRKMRKNLTDRIPKPTGAAARAVPVDEARCQAAWTGMQEFARTKGGFEPRLSCARLAKWLEGEKFDDEALRALLITHGLVPSSIHHQAQRRGGLIAAIGGRWTRELAPRYRATMLAFPLANRTAGDTALAALESHICLATVGFELHSEANDEGLDAWLAQWCPGRKASAWRKDALADPRGSLVGIPAARLGPLPTDMVPVVEYGWAMYGTSLELSRPLNAPRPSAQTKPGYTIENIDPTNP
jgi:hypothetical protein